MSFLFPWENIRARRIPEREDFDRMRTIIMKAVEPNSNILAASVYGSVLRGDHTSRSDLDLVIVSRNSGFSDTHKLIDELSLQARERNIVLCTRLYSVTEARAGQHPFGPSYRETMKQIVRDGNAKGVPHQWLTWADDDIRREMEFKVLFNLNKLARQFSAFRAIVGDNLTPKSLNAWLNATYRFGERPFHVYMGCARWLLWWQNSFVYDDSKRNVINTFLHDVGFASLRNDFCALLAFDREYDLLLEQARKNRVSRFEYHNHVLRMVKAVFHRATCLLESAHKFMRKNKRAAKVRLVA